MSKLNDEMLNDYVDNNLSLSKISEIDESIKSDNNELMKLRAHKYIHQTLKEIPVYEAPLNFTQKMMSKISETVSITYEANTFFKVMIGIFVTIISGFLVYSFEVASKSNSSIPFSFKNDVLDRIVAVFPSISALFSSSTVVLVGSGLIIVLFFASFYMIESHLNFKKKIGHFSK